MAMQYLGSWTNTECRELIKVLHCRTSDVDKDMSDPKEVRLIEDEITSCLTSFTPTQYHMTPGEILWQIRHFIRMYNRFVSFISHTQITYNVESNLVHVHRNYNYNKETPEETRFRLDGFEYYEAMNEVLEGSVIESVAWWVRYCKFRFPMEV